MVDDDVTLLARAHSHYINKEYEKAAAYCEQIMSHRPFDVRVPLFYSRMLQRLGSERLAKRVLAFAVSVHSNNLPLMEALSNAHLRLRELEKAEAILERILEVNHEFASAIALKARLLAAKGAFDEARALYLRTESVDSSFAHCAREGIALCERQRAWRTASIDPCSERTFDGHLQDGAPIAYVKRVFSEEECRVIKDTAVRTDPILGSIAEGTVVGEKRRSVVYWVSAASLPTILFGRLAACFEAARDALQTKEIDEIELTQIACYLDSHEGFFDWHTDAEKLSEGTVRKLSLSVQLSKPEAYAGGALQFRRGDLTLEAPRGVGEAIIFPSSVVHRITPVTRGCRWSLTCWARSRVGGVQTNLRMLS